MSFGIYACCPPPPVPTILGNPSSLIFQQIQGTPSASQTVLVTGTNLTTNILVTASPGYEVSLNGSTWLPAVTVVQAGGNASQTVYVRLNAISTGNYNLPIVLTSTGASNFNITTTGKNLNPTISRSPSSLTFVKHNPNVSSSMTFNVSGVDLISNVALNAPADFEISIDNFTFGSSLSLAPTAGILSSTIIYVRFTKATVGASAGNIACSATSATTVNVAVSGTYSILNAYEFDTGTVPSIALFQNNYVSGILNPVIVNDTIYFENTSWIPILSNKFTSNADLLTVISSQNEIKRDYNLATGLTDFEGLNPVIDNSGGMFSGAIALVDMHNTVFVNLTSSNFIGTAIADFTFLEFTTSITGIYNFQNCSNATAFDFSGITTPNFGATAGDDSNFDGITGQTIAITAKIAHQTNNLGLMDGDFDAVDTANTVTFTWV